MVGELSILSQPGMPDSPQPMLTLISVVTICSHASTRKNEQTPGRDSKSGAVPGVALDDYQHERYRTRSFKHTTQTAKQSQGPRKLFPEEQSQKLVSFQMGLESDIAVLPRQVDKCKFRLKRFLHAELNVW